MYFNAVLLARDQKRNELLIINVVPFRENNTSTLPDDEDRFSRDVMKGKYVPAFR